uniref:Uncharacterized protein n=1 Tax=Micrurus corallinus TaxID=54390 RepID=A0A2D4GMZ4_MICCO
MPLLKAAALLSLFVQAALAEGQAVPKHSNPGLSSALLLGGLRGRYPVFKLGDRNLLQARGKWVTKLIDEVVEGLFGELPQAQCISKEGQAGRSWTGGLV